jgi:hypothetical protein
VEGFPHTLFVTSFDISKVATDLEALMPYANSERVIDGRLDLTFSTDEVFASWCALQTDGVCESLAFSNGGVTFGNDNECTRRVDDTDVPIDCQKSYLCETDRCNFGHLQSYLNLRKTSTGLVGTFNDAVVLNERGFSTWLGSVHFVPAQPSAPQTTH